MIKEVNLKLNLTGDQTIDNFQELWFITDAYYSILFNQKEKKIELSKNFSDHLMDTFRLGLFETCKWFSQFDAFVDFRNEYGRKIANHNFFSFINLLFSEKGVKTNATDTLATKVIPKDKKYYLISGHDTSISSFLWGVDRRDVHVPDYASK